MFLKCSLSSIFLDFKEQALSFKYLLTLTFPTEQVGNRYNKIYSSSSSSESEDEEGEEEEVQTVLEKEAELSDLEPKGFILILSGDLIEIHLNF